MILRFAGLEEAKKLAGRVLRLIQDRLSDGEFGKNLAKLSNQFAALANPRFDFKKPVSLSSARTTKRFPSKRASITQIVRPSESRADTPNAKSIRLS